MEYPRHLHKAGGLYVVVANASDHEQLSAKGWALLPEAHVEQPVEVRLFEALREEVAEKPRKPEPRGPLGDASLSVTDLSVEEAKVVIAFADAVQLAAIEDEENAGKQRKGILALIEVRKADLLDD